MIFWLGELRWNSKKGLDLVKTAFFKVTRRLKSTSNGYNKMFQIPNKPVSVPKVNSGDLIFFPSFYPHFVTPHFFRGFERITFSANFLIVPAQ